MTAFLSATHLRQELEGRGIVIQLRGAHLLLSPRGVAHDLLPEVARLKPSLIQILQEEQNKAALARCPEAAKRYFSTADQLAIGRNLLALDAGQDIEGDAE